MIKHFRNVDHKKYYCFYFVLIVTRLFIIFILKLSSESSRSYAKKRLKDYSQGDVQGIQNINTVC